MFVLEPSELRRAKAEELGADITIDPLTDDPTEIFGNDIERPDYAFECSAAPSALETAVEILPHHGSLTLLGVATFPVNFHSYTIIRKELAVTGSSSYAEEFDIAIRLFERKALDVQPLTSEVVGLAPSALETAVEILPHHGSLTLLGVAMWFFFRT